MTTPVGRNDPCPCGSGRKYKHCCEGKLRLATRFRGTWLYAGLAVAAVAITVIAFALLGQNRATMTNSARSGSTPGAGRNTDGPPAAPWTYDAATNRHFDPGHNHWHDGPPPPVDQRGAASMSPESTGASTQTNPTAGTPPGAPGSTPAPWTYDSANNQHWDPNHGHWHPGPPPTTGTR